MPAKVIKDGKALRFGSGDNAAIALVDLKPGDEVGFAVLRGSVRAGHKFALGDIAAGEEITLYGGEAIGKATCRIAAGEHIHSHNMTSALASSRLDAPWGPPQERRPVEPPGARTSFLGYARNLDGVRRVGTRNDVWIIPTVGCACRIARELATLGNRLLADRIGSSVDNVQALEHPFGCSEARSDLLERTQPILLSHALHPNAGAVLLVRLGCEDNGDFVDLLHAGGHLESGRVQVLTLQEVDTARYSGPIDAGRPLLEHALSFAEESRRETCAVRDLILGVKCGASGPFSGLTGNPLLGRAADVFSDLGATVVISELPEFFGAEHVFLGRATSPDVHGKLKHAFRRYRQYLESIGEPLDTNPSPGNIDAGLSTIEQKALGAVKKGGSGPVVDCLDYGERASPCGGGLVLVYGPGGDTTAITVLEAAGAGIIAWVTQLGTGVGAFVPTLKIFARSEEAKRLSFWCDYNAGRLLERGTFWEECTAELYHLLLDVAEGKRTKNEENGEQTLAIWSRISK